MKVFGGAIKIKDAKNTLTYITFTGASYSTVTFVDTSVSMLDKLVKGLEYNAITNALDTDANSLVCTSMYLPGARRSWGSWRESHLINKYQDGCRGEIDVSLSTKDVIKFCGWKNPKDRK